MRHAPRDAFLAAHGFDRAGDVAGGFEAWAAAGLPVAVLRAEPDPNGLPGMGPPD